MCTQPPHLKIALHEPSLTLSYRRVALSGTSRATELAPGRGSPYIEWWEGTILLLLLLACAHDITERECTNICVDYFADQCPDLDTDFDPEAGGGGTVQDYCAHHNALMYDEARDDPYAGCIDDADYVEDPACPIDVELCEFAAENREINLRALGYCG